MSKYCTPDVSSRWSTSSIYSVYRRKKEKNYKNLAASPGKLKEEGRKKEKRKKKKKKKKGKDE